MKQCDFFENSSDKEAGFGLPLPKTLADFSTSTIAAALREYSGNCPNSGLLRGGRLWILKTSESRKDVDGSSLSHVLEKNVPKKYFLSKRACEGILKRAKKRGKEENFPPILRQALEGLEGKEFSRLDHSGDTRKGSEL